MTRRRFGSVAIVVAVVLVWAGTMVWIAFQPVQSGGELGIDVEQSHGAAGLTSVLEDHGVEVRPAQSERQLRSELKRDPEAIVLFHDKNSVFDSFSASRMMTLDDLIPAEQRVFAGVGNRQQQFLLEGVEGTGTMPYADKFTVETSCVIPGAQQAQNIAAFPTGLILSQDATGCFGLPENTSQPMYSIAQTATGSIVFADAQMLSNHGLYDNGLSTVALWTFGRADTVIWFQPDFMYDPTDDPLSTAQVPEWVRFGIIWAVISGVIYFLHRGRRDGPIVVEPLPVEVPAAETTVGRGRLYATGPHILHSLQALQQASLDRITKTLRVSPQDDAVLAQVATALSMPLNHLITLYSVPSGPITNQQFVTWSHQLQDIEHQVHQHVSAPTKES